MPQPQCEFYTAGVTRCSNSARGGTHYCGVHTRKAEALGERPEGCPCTRRVDGALRWCGQPFRAGEPICEWHWLRVRQVENRAQQRRNRAATITETTQLYLAQNPQPTWQQVARDVQRRNFLPREHPDFIDDIASYDIARRFFVMTTPGTVPLMTFINFWMVLWRGEPEGDGIWVAQAPLLVLPVGPMARLAADTQNVHTAPIAKQTNDNVDILLATPVADDQATESMLTLWWLTMARPPKFVDYFKVMSDVHHWYTQKTCKKANDYLYRRVLRGALAKIEADPNKADLIQRLWEECEESVGMCCEGHISRLANVFVGFDETFKSPASLGEVLQTRIAAIAEMKLSPKHKVAKATAVMEELGIPEADRAPWLEALAE